MEFPKVSVIIPCFNSENYIARALRSIINQSLDFSEYEIITVNDGSSDNTKNIINQFLDKVIYLENDINQGLPYALNKAVNIAKGEYFCRLDSDDFVNEHYLLFLLEYMKQHPDALVCKCDYFLVDEQGKNRKYTSSINHPIGCGTIFNKKFILDIGGYNTQFKCNEEKELFKRIFKYTNIHHLPMPLYRYRKHPGSMTSDRSLLREYDIKLSNEH
tara:strand:- start:960 stop:1607 length:648 start_codon:yes stop_codon:yes gene_type:complete